MRIRRSTVLAALGIAGLAIFLACQPVDSTKPTVVIVTPTAGETLAQGNVAVKVHATDDEAMSRVEFYIDNALKGVDSVADADTWRWTWDATSESLSHAIKVKAYDSTGNMAEKTNNVYVRVGVGTIHDHDISSDETWYPSGNPHWVTQGIAVGNDARLTIMPGCLVKFYTGTDAGLLIGNTVPGELIAVGKPDSLITFTSNAAAPAKGDWVGIHFANGARPTSHLSYCVIDYGGRAGAGAVGAYWGASVILDHCTIRRSAGLGVSTNEALCGRVVNFTGNTITECTGYPMDVLSNNIRHLLSGNTFTANGVQGIMVRGRDVCSTGTWLNQGVPYVVQDDEDIGFGGDDNPVITIQAGTTIKFGTGSSMTVGYTINATLIAEGDTLNPITFTSAAATPQAGDWRFIWLAMGPLATQSKLKYCKILYAGGVSNEGNLLITGEASPVVQHCEIGYSQAYGIWLDGAVYPEPATLRAENNIHDNASGDIRTP